MAEPLTLASWRAATFLGSQGLSAGAEGKSCLQTWGKTAGGRLGGRERQGEKWQREYLWAFCPEQDGWESWRRVTSLLSHLKHLKIPGNGQKMEQCFEHETTAQQIPSEMGRNDSLLFQKRKGMGCGWFSVFLVPGLEVLAVANLLPESIGVYSSTSTLAGPAMPGAAALPTMQNWHLTDEWEEELTCKSSRSVVGAQI